MIKLPDSSALLKRGFIVLAAVIILGLGAGEYFLHKADAEVVFPSAQVKKNIVIGPEIPLKEATNSAQIQETVSATGVKQVGERAKGSVVIYNSSLESGQSLAKGTTLTGPNGLSFVLNDDVSVASASGDASNVTSSTSKGSVQAEQIGPEYNLSSGTKLSIEGGSSASVIAKVDSALTGGSKRQVKVISQKDLDSAYAAAEDKAQKSAAAAVSNAGSGNVIVKDLTKVALEKETYSENVGAEAESVSLSADAKTTYYYYQDSALKQMFVKKLSENLSKGTKILEESIVFTIPGLKDKEVPDDRKITFSLSAKAVPKTDFDSLKKRVAGKRVSAAQDIAAKEFGAVSLDIYNKPDVPPFSLFTPFIQSNLTIKPSYK